MTWMCVFILRIKSSSSWMEALSRMRHENSDASVVPSARTVIIIWSTLVCSRCGEQDGTQRMSKGAESQASGVERRTWNADVLNVPLVIRQSSKPLEEKSVKAETRPPRVRCQSRT